MWKSAIFTAQMEKEEWWKPKLLRIFVNQQLDCEKNHRNTTLYYFHNVFSCSLMSCGHYWLDIQPRLLNKMLNTDQPHVQLTAHAITSYNVQYCGKIP